MAIKSPPHNLFFTLVIFYCSSSIFIDSIEAGNGLATGLLVRTSLGRRMRKQVIDSGTNDTIVEYEYEDDGLDPTGTCAFVAKCWQTCDSERPLLYKGAKGLPGPTGPQGFKGSIGTEGSKGDKGDKGNQGAQGEQGERGQQGAKGEKGHMGARGSRGADDVGEPGDQGEAGEAGDSGDAGRQGCKGEKGDIGRQGAKGEQGLQGEPGARGETGLQGPKGTIGPVGAPGSEAGEQGPQGEKGEQGVQGIVGSPGGSGEKGVMGVPGRAGSGIMVNVTFHKHKLEKGEKGDKGPAGDCSLAVNEPTCQARGRKGDQGEKGELGAPGVLGLSGERGPPGQAKDCKVMTEDEFYETVEFIKGAAGRPASRPPIVMGPKGDPGPVAPCSCEGIECPPKMTVPCEPINYTVSCAYLYVSHPPRPGPRGPKGPKGERGPPGTEPGPPGLQGDAGRRGQCEKCKAPEEKEEVVTTPSIYVLHERDADSSWFSRFKRDATPPMKCARDEHVVLWRGYTFVGATVDKANDAFNDFGGTGSCLPVETALEKPLVSFANVLEAPSGFTQMRAQLDRSTWQQSFWLADKTGQKMSRCVVCRSLGPVSVFHGQNECPVSDKRQMRWVKLWHGRSLAMLGDRLGLGLESTGSCQPEIGVMQKNSCPSGQSCDEQKPLPPHWASGVPKENGVDGCAVCALEPASDVPHKLRGDGEQFVQHSQIGSSVSPGCRAGHTLLFDGYSLLSTNNEGGQISSCSASFVPLVTAADCVMSKNVEGRRMCKPQLEHSTWMLSADYVPTIVERAVLSQYHQSGQNNGRRVPVQPSRRVSVSPSQMEFLLHRKHNSTDLDSFQRQHVSRCSVCLSRAPIYVQHGLEATSSNDMANLTCRPGFTKLWHGYSFVMASMTNDGANQRVMAKDLSSPESCLRVFEPIMALDCPVTADALAILNNQNHNNQQPMISNLCKMPFSANRAASTLLQSGVTSTHWLALGDNSQQQALPGVDDAYFGEKHAGLISRCVVCELNV